MNKTKILLRLKIEIHEAPNLKIIHKDVIGIVIEQGSYWVWWKEWDSNLRGFLKFFINLTYTKCIYIYISKAHAFTTWPPIRIKIKSRRIYI